MKAELMREMAEQKELEMKARLCDELLTLLYNAVGYMYEQGEERSEVAEYLLTTETVLDAIDDCDYKALEKELCEED